jgi:hypothetical protein
LAGKAITINVHLEGADETIRAFRRMPKQASDSLRQRSTELASTLARRIASAASADSAQSALMASTVKAQRDRVPAIVAGGTKRVGRHRNPAFGILFGSEFGMGSRSGWYAAQKFNASMGRQFRPWTRKHSYWLFRTFEVHKQEIAKAWAKVVEDITRDFSGGA